MAPFYAAINTVRPSLIRIHADEVTYPMHVILRIRARTGDSRGQARSFAICPERWNEKMSAYLGIDVPDDGRGALQDIHWGMGPDRVFPTYLARERHDGADLGECGLGRTSAISRSRSSAASLPPLREWLGENIHAHGRKLTPQEILVRATGSPSIRAQPYLDYLGQKHGAAAPA